ncbi:MAG TPA: hypothetical protein VGM41_20720 [Chitinophagaceae bacterium]
MTQKKYYSRLNKIKYPEWIGSAICVLAAAYIGFNFGQLDNVFFQFTGILAILLLLIIPALGLMSLSQFNIIDDSNKPYTETLRQFAVQKVRFQKFQKINAFLSYLLLVTVIILLSKLFKGRDMSKNYYFWSLAFPIGYVYLLLLLKLVKKFYGKALRQAEELLKELDGK